MWVCNCFAERSELVFFGEGEGSFVCLFGVFLFCLLTLMLVWFWVFVPRDVWPGKNEANN